jgi:small conductance mechanosensitive channel
MQGYADSPTVLVVQYGPQLLLAIVVLLLGLWIIKRVVRLVGRSMEASSTETSLAKFLSNLTSMGLKTLLLISVASMIGLETTSFIAVLGAAGLAI